MAYSRLRVFYGPGQQERDTAAELEPHRVTVPLGDVLPVLADAMQMERGWVNDFLDDEITIPTDLYEVLLAYQHYRRPAG